MKFIKLMPFHSELDWNKFDTAVYQSSKNVCEFQSSQDQDGKCDPSGHYYGTSDEREPKFCARHFYRLVVNGDGVTNHKLVDNKEEK